VNERTYRPWPSVRVSAVFLLCSVISVSAANQHAAAERPNIILIMADDLGYAELGCYGQKKIETPHIDSLAKEGIKFTQFYCGAPVCAPSRCVLMTGKHLAHAQVRNNSERRPGKWDSFGGQMPLEKGTVTIARLLKRAGYATGAFGKWGLGGVGTSGDPLKQGFDRFFGYNCQRHAHNFYPRYLIDDDRQRELPGNDRGRTGKHYAPQVIADELLEFIRDNHEKPLFVYYPTIIPHLALQAPDEEIAKYKGRWPETPYTGRSYQPHPTPKACYAAMISFMDRQVGRIVKELERLGIRDNTIILFTSDNGVTHLKQQVDYEFFNSTGPLRGQKGSVFEGGIRVPLVVNWPGKIAGGRSTDHISAAYDVLPTLCQIAGVKPPQDIDGISFLPTLKGITKEQEKHDYLVWEFHGYGGQQAVRMGDWKAIRRNCHRNPDGPIQLYNLAEDIGETKDLAAAKSELARKMARIMEEAHGESAVWNFGGERKKKRRN